MTRIPRKASNMVKFTWNPESLSKLLGCSFLGDIVGSHDLMKDPFSKTFQQMIKRSKLTRIP